jgi:hypothetical protein
MTSYRIGRGSENDIVVDDASISRVHAELATLPDGSFALRDLGSSNGTMVQGADGWEMVDKATVEPDQPIRLGKRQLTASELVALGNAAAPDVPADDPRSERYSASTDSGESRAGSTEREVVVRASSLPRWVVPTAAAGGGAILIAVVAVVLLLGPLGGASSSDFVRTCSLQLGSKSKCTCWADGLKARLSGQDFVELTVAIRKRDWQTAMPPALRQKFTAASPAIEAKCGPLG